MALFRNNVWPTLGYVMTENWINGCCGLNKDVGDSHLGHTENGHKKTAPRIRFVNHGIFKHYWNELQ